MAETPYCIRKTIGDGIWIPDNLGYNHAVRQKRYVIGFLLILLQSLVTASTRAIRPTLERRLEAIKLPDAQLSLFPSEGAEGWSELDGQKWLPELTPLLLIRMDGEKAHD